MDIKQMKTFSLTILTLILSINSCYPNKANLWKLGLNIYGEKGFRYSLGIGIRYGKNTVKFKPTNHHSKGIIDNPFKGFTGMTLKYNQSITDLSNQIELGFQTGNIINIGCFITNINTENMNSIGIKPIIGVSFSNFELNYGYYITPQKWSSISKNNLIIAYRI